MTLLQYKTKANAVLTNFWQTLKVKQDEYFSKHGKYFQLIISPSAGVVDGEDTDYTITKPNDEKHAIDVNLTWATKIPFQISVDEWVGPDGDVGYSVSVTATVNGKKYMRTRDSNNQDTNWFEYVGVVI